MIESFANGTYQLANLNGALHASRVNGLSLKKYHVRLMKVSKDGRLEKNSEVVKNMPVFDVVTLTTLFVVADHE